jgi:tRNA (guanine37-N1)-methyltransferase
MNLHVISLFPEMFSALTDYGVVGRTIRQKVLSLNLYNPRDYASDRRSSVDDRPYGGGPGMVMMAEPLSKAIAAARHQAPAAKIIYLSPQGERFNHRAAEKMATQKEAILLAGRYEGVDERLLTSEIDEEWSIGDFVLSGGELAAMVIIDAVARLLPDSLGNDESAKQDSFARGLLDCPHYTRPEVFKNLSVPPVLLSGDHQRIDRWRMKQALGRTWLRRPDLLYKLDLSDEQVSLLEEFKQEN